MASQGHPNSAQPVRPDGRGGYVSAVYEPDDNVMDAGGAPGDGDDQDVDELDLCPTCQGTGRVTRRVAQAPGPDTHVEADVAARALAGQRAEAMAAYGALTGGLRMAPMPRN